MAQRADPLAGWTPEEIAVGRRWVETWKHAGEALERVRLRELRELDQYQVDRSSIFDYPPGIALRTCSAEDLIVMKSFGGRGQDWVDVERVIGRQHGRLDWDYIARQLIPLAELKGEPGILDRLEKLRVQLERQRHSTPAAVPAPPAQWQSTCPDPLTESHPPAAARVSAAAVDVKHRDPADPSRSNSRSGDG